MHFYNTPQHYKYANSPNPQPMRSPRLQPNPQPHPLYIPGPASGYQTSPVSPQRLVRPPPPNYKSYHYNSDRIIYAGDWGVEDYITLGSYNEDPHNKISIVQPNLEDDYFINTHAEIDLKMPPTKLKWQPSNSVGNSLNYSFISSGDSLNLYDFTPSTNEIQQKASFSKASRSEQKISAPLTSFDWCKEDPNLVITSSIDTTCTIWDISKQAVKTQLISHDCEVFDVSFFPNDPSQFVSIGADGSARTFDTRSLNNSTIVYEHPQNAPLLRIVGSPASPHTFAVFGQQDKQVHLIDTRSTRNVMATLNAHKAQINCALWVPNNPNLLATCSDDCQVLLWDVSQTSVVAAYTDIQQVNNLLASPSGEWLGSISGKSLQGIQLNPN